MEDVYEELAPSVIGYFRSRGVADPEDLCGDVFASAARGLPRFRGDAGDLRRWVFTIAHHRLVDEYRSASRNREQPVPHTPDVAADQRDTAIDQDLIDALALLTDDQREVVTLRFVADLSIADVARLLGKRTGAVKMLQARGLDDLRHRLGGAVPESSGPA